MNAARLLPAARLIAWSFYGMIGPAVIALRELLMKETKAQFFPLIETVLILTIALSAFALGCVTIGVVQKMGLELCKLAALMLSTAALFSATLTLASLASGTHPDIQSFVHNLTEEIKLDAPPPTAGWF